MAGDELDENAVAADEIVAGNVVDYDAVDGELINGASVGDDALPDVGMDDGAVVDENDDVTDNGSVEEAIVNNIKNFLVTQKQGTKSNIATQAKHAVLTACTFGVDRQYEKIQRAIGVCKGLFYKHHNHIYMASNYKQHKRKGRLDLVRYKSNVLLNFPTQTKAQV